MKFAYCEICATLNIANLQLVRSQEQRTEQSDSECFTDVRTTENSLDDISVRTEARSDDSGVIKFSDVASGIQKEKHDTHKPEIEQKLGMGFRGCKG